jgi:hypothetical protein
MNCEEAERNGLLEKIGTSKLVLELSKDCFLPKRVYVMELANCCESFMIQEEYSLPDWIFGLGPLCGNFGWTRVENGVYVMKSFYRPVAVADLMKLMMQERGFNGTLKLWNLPEQIAPK